MSLNLDCFNDSAAGMTVFRQWQDNIEDLLKQLLKSNNLKINDRLLTISLILAEDNYIRDLNKEFRKIDKSTDVITFPFAPKDKEARPDQVYLAEVYISFDTASAQAGEYKLNISEELVVLSVHGILHAFGYDHEKSIEGGKKMKDFEQILIDSVLNPGIDSLTKRT